MHVLASSALTTDAGARFLVAHLLQLRVLGATQTIDLYTKFIKCYPLG
jgi:hypothetical protein